MKRKIIIEWYDEYSVLLFKYITKMIKDSYQAEDLMQETFIKAYQFILKEDIKHPKTLLFRIAHNLTIDYIRKHGRVDIVKDIFLKDNRQSTESIIEVRENAEGLYRAIQSLKITYREVIILRKIEEFSIKETASILNWSESKVKSTLSRAMHALEKQLVKGGVMYEEKNG